MKKNDADVSSGPRSQFGLRAVDIRTRRATLPGMRARVTVRLPVRLLALAKGRAAAEGRSLTSLIEDGLWRVVTEKGEKKPGARYVELRVSKATGGPMPGVDISNSAALQEMDDLEYIERLKHFK